MLLTAFSEKRAASADGSAVARCVSIMDTLTRSAGGDEVAAEAVSMALASMKSLAAAGEDSGVGRTQATALITACRIAQRGMKHEASALAGAEAASKAGRRRSMASSRMSVVGSSAGVAGGGGRGSLAATRKPLAKLKGSGETVAACLQVRAVIRTLTLTSRARARPWPRACRCEP